MKTLAVLFLAVTSVQAADHVITWSPNPAFENIIEYRFYEQFGGNWVLQATTPTNGVVKSNVAVGTHTYSFSAYNALGEGPKSIPVIAVVPSLPSAPTNIVVNLRASFQASPDLTNWHDFVSLTVPAQASDQERFFRSRVGITQ